MKALSTNLESDHNLIEAVLDFGDEKAFRILYRRHTPRLFGFISRLIGAGNLDEEDIVQETWLRACKNLRQFQNRSLFSTWLLGIGLNLVRDNLRRKGKSQIVSDNDFTNLPGRDEDYGTRIDLGRAIGLLPDEFRLVLVLHDIEGFAHHEIAEQLEIPIGTTKSQLFRARRMIRDWLSEENGVKNEQA